MSTDFFTPPLLQVQGRLDECVADGLPETELEYAAVDDRLLIELDVDRGSGLSSVSVRGATVQPSCVEQLVRGLVLPAPQYVDRVHVRWRSRYRMALERYRTARTPIGAPPATP